MNIGVDARSLVQRKVGFGHFLENILISILEIDHSNQYYLFSDREIVSNTEKYENVHIIEYTDTKLCPKSFFFYFRLSRLIKNKIDLDVFWGTQHLLPKGLDKKTKRILTIHDFTHLKFPESTTKFNLLISKLFFAPSIKMADYIICISNNTAKELIEYYSKETKGKSIITIYEGGLIDYHENKSYDLQNVSPKIQNLSKERFILFVGTIEPRKNIQLLIEAAPKLENICRVVICGKIGWENKKTVKKLQSTNNLFFENYINDDERNYLMNKCFCLVQPSLYEGFGLPVVESIQSGTVVIVANNSSLKELIELEGLKFETNDSDDLVAKVKNLTIEENYSVALQYCNNRAQFFSWEKAAKEYLRILIK